MVVNFSRPDLVNFYSPVDSIYQLSLELVGHAVVMAIHFDVLVDVYPGNFPFGKLIGVRGKRF